MSANSKQAILDKIQALTYEKQQEVLALVDEMLKAEQHTQAPKNGRPIGEIIEELSSQIPLDEWAELPTDGAEQHNHYVYGSPNEITPIRLLKK
jgi:hypothetical protein